MNGAYGREDQLARTFPSTITFAAPLTLFFYYSLDFTHFTFWSVSRLETTCDGEQVIRPPLASAAMGRSEIDDIFAAKKSTAGVVAQPTASTSASTDATGSKKKKKGNKRKRRAKEARDLDVDEEKPQKKRVVETVLDPSTTVPSTSSSKVPKAGKGTGTAKPKASKKEKEDLERFKDSRGTVPRKR